MTKFFKDYIRAFRHKKILKIIKVPKNGSVLDLSCSDGKFLSKLHSTSPDLKLYGIDIAEEDILKAKEDLPFGSFSKQNVDKLDFQDNTFDLVFSILSLHHYDSPRGFFNEASRILKPSGVLYLSDLIPKYIWTQKIHNWRGCPEPYHFEKFYSIKDLEKILYPLGFRLIKDSNVTLVPRIRLLTIQKS